MINHNQSLSQSHNPKNKRIRLNKKEKIKWSPLKMQKKHKTLKKFLYLK